MGKHVKANVEELKGRHAKPHVEDTLEYLFGAGPTNRSRGSRRPPGGFGSHVSISYDLINDAGLASDMNIHPPMDNHTFQQASQVLD